MAKINKIEYPTGNHQIDWLLKNDRNGLNEDGVSPSIRFLINKMNEIISAQAEHSSVSQANELSPLVSNSALQDNDKLVDNMCMSYRHDFGLMDKEQQDKLRFECKEWLRAYENNREHCC